ncbi:hypothetical protein CC78DRAFT_533497 [Lojkania enalia]|uniref:Uncharacterized protein n=1 Tax=Lojkania enalia TaxID=147567 RepID=A0A9P4K7J4_9PLEO|nr:hypothetical protein CC78DRAFT_533497 [Didymosphaeria enalia]
MSYITRFPSTDAVSIPQTPIATNIPGSFPKREASLTGPAAQSTGLGMNMACALAFFIKGTSF